MSLYVYPQPEGFRGVDGITPQLAPSDARTWLQLYKTATQANPTAGQTISWQTSFGTIPYSAVTNRWSLTAGRNYRIYLQIGGQFGGTGGRLEVGLYAVTPAAFLHAASGSASAYSQTYTWAAVGGVNPQRPATTVVMYTPPADTDMEVRVVSAASCTGAYRSLQGSTVVITEA